MRAVVLAVFALSGAAGLIYEVVWSRELVLVFGNTTQAIATILTGFFAGMAVGSVAGGRAADRMRSPLRLYAALEIAIAAIALATPALFGVVRASYRDLYPSLENAPLALGLLRFGLSLAALAPATVLMGATLPTLSRHLARASAEVSDAFGRLYAANTIGGLAGALVSGFALIEMFGLSGALTVGALCSAAAGLTALGLSTRLPAAPLRRTVAKPPRERGLALIVAFVSGLTSLGYQVLWTRLLSSGSDNTTYVFTGILALFLSGIAVGALLFSIGVGRRESPHELLGAYQLAVGGIAVIGVVFIATVPVFLGVVILVVVLPATLVMGLALPIASGLAAQRDSDVGGDTGLLLAANTLGIVVATFAVPFLLIPAIGSPHAVIALALVNLTLGSALLLRRRGAARVIGPALGAVVLVAVGSGAPLFLDPGAARVALAGQLFATAEDEIASVQAGRLGRDLHLWVAGTSMTKLTVDAKLMVVLPAMLRPDARNALIIAFGMGSSYREALRAGLGTTGVELVPSVPRMFRYYFADAPSVLADPHGRLVIADGRNHVELTSDRYDVVVVDPPPPIRTAGAAVLYSREFYAASADRLTDGGVMMEWMPYDQSVDEFRSHVRTFSDVFPNVIVSFGPGGNGVFMLGSRAPLTFQRTAIDAVLSRPGIVDDLAASPDARVRTAREWADLIPSLVWLSGDAVRDFAADAPPITDDRPRSEYFLLRSVFGAKSPPMNESHLRAAASLP